MEQYQNALIGLEIDSENIPKFNSDIFINNKKNW
ncbi:MAG: hypothetical protein KatS3mg068_2255 [Candidatus Sericytochromatia bacterium]|nr:MAG: hypothetical protein KatS3mg068_2255 [Candidatus Sericytochromatia bacterium]